MLEQVLDFIHNYFEYKKICGEFSIENGVLNVDFLQDGQFYKVVGSVFNDGVWQYGNNGLHDETFIGEVWALAIPPRLLSLADEIGSWVDANKDVINSPYQSESFGGYSYTKGGGNAGESDGNIGWRSIFGSQLNQWRKIS